MRPRPTRPARRAQPEPSALTCVPPAPPAPQGTGRHPVLCLPGAEALTLADLTAGALFGKPSLSLREANAVRALRGEFVGHFVKASAPHGRRRKGH